MAKSKKKQSWKEEAWEIFLTKFWDNRTEDLVVYSKQDLFPILSKYKESGRGEIRIFHYEHEKLNAVKSRNVMKIPISRTEWGLVERPRPLHFVEPEDGKEVSDATLTEGMRKAIEASRYSSANPGETTLLAIAKRLNIIDDFYQLGGDGVWFTGGRQNAIGAIIDVNQTKIDLSKAQIEIDGGFEWDDSVVIVEMKSSFNQVDFDNNQALIPILKWQYLLSKKRVFSLVLLAQVFEDRLEYWAFDLVQDETNKPFGMQISRSGKYIIKLEGV